jgi:hypothetical protein
MKRFLLLTCAGTLCALALLTIYCTERPFDNPLDEKAHDEGKNNHWLWKIDPDVCNAIFPGIPDCPNYVRNCYLSNTCGGIDTSTIKGTLGGCADEEKLKIELVGGNPVTLADNQEPEYRKLMGKSGTQWEGVVNATSGANIKAVLTINGTDLYTGDSTKIPPVGTYYIRYIATRPKCENNSQFEEVPETRTLIIEQYIPNDTVPPTITFTNFQTEYTAAPGLWLNDAASVSTNRGSILTRTPPREDTIYLSEPRTFTVTYKACKDVTVNSVTTNKCVEEPKTIIVKEPSSGTYPTPVIVFSKYSYSADGNAFSSPDTAFLFGGTFREPGQGNISAYYMKDGAKQPINVTLGGNLTVSTSDLPTAQGRPSPDGYPVRYTLAPAPGEYAEAKGTRMVYLTTSGFCEGTPTMSFTNRKLDGSQLSGAAPALTIPANTPWSDPMKSFIISRSEDGEAYDVNGYKMGLYSSGTPKLDVDNPQPGTYSIKYVGLTECSNSGGQFRFFTSAERTVTVNP